MMLQTPLSESDHKEPTMPNDRDLYTSGYLAQLLQRPVQAIEEDLRETGYKPALTINHVPHWTVDAMIFLTSHARKVEANG
jgi:hypothetical protein